MMLTREDEIRHLKLVAGNVNQPLMDAIYALLESKLEKAMDAVVDAPREDLLLMQGQAQAYKAVLKYLKERSAAAAKV